MIIGYLDPWGEANGPQSVLERETACAGIPRMIAGQTSRQEHGMMSTQHF